MTKSVSKQLLAVYDKPMIYYPLTTLIEHGIHEIVIVADEASLGLYRKLLGDGSTLGLCLKYVRQPEPKGIAQALTLSEEHIRNDYCALILGDNIFCGMSMVIPTLYSATILACEVADPARYGVVEVMGGVAMSIEEKPEVPKSRLAVPGFYLYPPGAIRRAAALQPSARGEYEITDLNAVYMAERKLKVVTLDKSVAWFDAGTADSLLEASCYVQAYERRTGRKLGCPEAAAFHEGFIDRAGLTFAISLIPNCPYKDYLKSL